MWLLISKRILRVLVFFAAGVACATVPQHVSASMVPILVATGGKTGLEFWPIEPKGSRTPTAIDGLRGLSPSGSIAANGDDIIIPNTTNILVFNLQSKHERLLADPDGDPLDVAVGRDGTIYAANFTSKGSNVLVYPPHDAAYDVTCGLSGPDSIAVDNEGDVFLNDQVLTAVVEIPNIGGRLDPSKCTQLHLTPREGGYTAGIAIDPKTDDLLVLDDPSYCAGGPEGRLVIHPKPYEQGRGRALQLGRNCSGGLRLNATSTLVFIGDQSVSGPPSYILQRTYPDGKPFGAYGGGGSGPGSFITIPNTLPN